MVTLERIDNQKRQLLKVYYAKGSKVKRHLGQEIKPHSLVLSNVTFGLKSRYQALLSLLENELAGRLKHFMLSGSAATSTKLNAILESIEENCSQSLNSIYLTDLSNPIKKSTVLQLCQMLSSKSLSKYTLTLERCQISAKTMTLLLESL